MRPPKRGRHYPDGSAGLGQGAGLAVPGARSGRMSSSSPACELGWSDRAPARPGPRPAPRRAEVACVEQTGSDDPALAPRSSGCWRRSGRRLAFSRSPPPRTRRRCWGGRPSRTAGGRAPSAPTRSCAASAAAPRRRSTWRAIPSIAARWRSRCSIRSSRPCIGPERFLREIEIAATPAAPAHPAAVRLRRASTACCSTSCRTSRASRCAQTLAPGGRLPLDDALRIAREVAGALDYSHRRGVVHRDIKPENILLQDGQAIVADFGIARAIDAGRRPSRPSGPRHGNAGVHEPGAGRLGGPHRWPDRHLRAGMRAVRDARRPPAIRWRIGRADPRGAPPWASAGTLDLWVCRAAGGRAGAPARLGEAGHRSVRHRS